jgi:hypothetical protein
VLDMNCRDFDTAILDMGRGVPLAPETERATLAHLEHCAACRLRLERERTLTSGLRALAGATPGLAEPDRMERRLVERLAALASGAEATPASASRWGRWLAAAAAVVIVSGLAIGWRMLQAPPAPTDETATATEWVAWPGAAVLPAFESGELVRTELPASVLPLLGFTLAGLPREGRVAADVVYGQDGEARAVRLVMTDLNRP